MQLPVFPAGAAEINRVIAVQKEETTVCYIHGHLPVFQHEEQDVQSFRMFTSQLPHKHRSTENPCLRTH